MGSKSTKTTQTNEPPKWARPMLERGAADALALYEQGKGYNTYTGPTQAPLSDPTLSGMNSLLAATGYSGAPVSNQSINSLIPDLSALFEQVKNRNSAAPQQQAQPSYTTDIMESLRTGIPYAAKIHNKPGRWIKQDTPGGEQWTQVEGDSSRRGLW